jgi:hypothetical protein
VKTMLLKIMSLTSIGLFICGLHSDKAMAVLPVEFDQGSGGSSAAQEARQETFESILQDDKYEGCRTNPTVMLHVAGLDPLICNSKPTRCSQHNCKKQLVDVASFQSEIDKTQKEINDKIIEQRSYYLQKTVFRTLADMKNRFDILGYGNQFNTSDRFCNLSSTSEILSQIKNKAPNCSVGDDDLRAAIDSSFSIDNIEMSEQDLRSTIQGFLEGNQNGLSESLKNKLQNILQNEDYSQEQIYKQLGKNTLAEIGLWSSKFADLYRFRPSSSDQACFLGRHLEVYSALPSAEDIESFLNLTSDTESFLSLFLTPQVRDQYDTLLLTVPDIECNQDLRDRAANGAEQFENCLNVNLADMERIRQIMDREPAFRMFLETPQDNAQGSALIEQSLSRLRTYYQKIQGPVNSLRQQNPGSGEYDRAVNAIRTEVEKFYDPNGATFGNGSLETIYNNYCDDAISRISDLFCSDPDFFETDLMNKIAKGESEPIYNHSPPFVTEFVESELACSFKSENALKIWSDNYREATQKMISATHRAVSFDNAAMARASTATSLQTQPGTDGEKSPLGLLCELLIEQVPNDANCNTEEKFAQNWSGCRYQGLTRLFSEVPLNSQLQTLMSESPEIKMVVGMGFVFDNMIVDEQVQSEMTGRPTNQSIGVGDSLPDSSIQASSRELFTSAVSKIKNRNTLTSEVVIPGASNNATLFGGTDDAPAVYDPNAEGGSLADAYSPNLARVPGASFLPGAVENPEEAASQLENENQGLLDRISSLESQLAEAQRKRQDERLPASEREDAFDEVSYLTSELNRLRDKIEQNEETIQELRERPTAPAAVAQPAQVPYALPQFPYAPTPASPGGSAPAAGQTTQPEFAQPSDMAAGSSLGAGSDRATSTTGSDPSVDAVVGPNGDAARAAGGGVGPMMNIDRASLQVVKADESYVDLLQQSANSDPQRFFEYLQELGVSDQSFVIQDPNDPSKEYLVNYQEQDGRIVVQTELLAAEVAAEEATREPASVTPAEPEEERSSGLYEKLLEDATR